MSPGEQSRTDSVPMGSTSGRSRVSRSFLTLSFLLTIVAGPSLYVSTVIEDEDAFVSVADEVIAHPETRSAIAGAVTEITFEAVAADELLAEALPDEVRTFAVPLTQIAATRLTDAAFTLLDTDLVIEAGDSALREVHRQVTSGEDEVVIDLRAVLVRTSRELGGPTVGAGVAKLVSDQDTGQFVLAEAGSRNSRLLAAVAMVPAIGLLIVVASLGSLVAGILAAVDRRRAMVVGGLAVAGAGAISTVVVAVVLFGVLGSVGGGSSAGIAVAEVISADFAQQQRGIILNGIVLAAIGLLLGNRPSAVALRALPANLWHRRPGTLQSIGSVIGDNPPLARAAVWMAGLLTLAVWSTPTARVLISIIVLTGAAHVVIWIVTSSNGGANRWRHRLDIASPEAAGFPTGRTRTNVAVISVLLFLLWPGWTQSVVTAFFVIGGLVQALVDLPAARRLARSRQPVETVLSTFSRRRRYVMASVAALLALILGVVVTTASADRVEAASGCNGHVELCDRRIDEVVFAGSHNAMSSIDLGWELALQTGDIVAQLDHGIRALLIDALYWDNTGTLEGGEDGAAATRIEAALGDDQPRTGTWLCHGYCALGATDLTTALADIGLWLDSHPREVLLIVVQDEITSTDLKAAFDSSGLGTYAHNHVPGTPFPTLGELIESGERVVTYAENQGRADDWLQNAWDSAFTETPFTFALRSDFSCAANRGKPDNPLFLINHWLTTGIPVREAAAAVNSRTALLDRVRTCETERGRLPTVLATDFVQTGDLVEVVDELNGIDN